MARYLYVVFSAPTTGRESDYNKWYDQQHLGDVLTVPAFVSAQRFHLADDNDAEAAPYLALYQIETDDPKAALAELQRRAGTAAMPISDALDFTRVKATLYRTLGSPVTR